MMLSTSWFGRLGTPMTKLLKSISGTPSTLGLAATIPGAPPAPESNPRAESVVPVPPRGLLNVTLVRKYPTRNSLTDAAPKVLVSPRLILLVWPVPAMLNPGYSGAFEAQYGFTLVQRSK